MYGVTVVSNVSVNTMMLLSRCSRWYRVSVANSSILFWERSHVYHNDGQEDRSMLSPPGTALCSSTSAVSPSPPHLAKDVRPLGQHRGVTQH